MTKTTDKFSGSTFHAVSGTEGEIAVLRAELVIDKGYLPCTDNSVAKTSFGRTTHYVFTVVA